MIPDAWLVDIKARTDLVALGESRGVQWQHSQGKVRACCPFHAEKTPSFHVLEAPRKGAPRFVCYGACNRSWSAVSFLVDGFRVDFQDALAELAARLGLEVPRGPEAEGARRQRLEAQERRQAILSAIDCAQEYFVKALWAERPEASAAREYIEQRQLSPAVEAWGFGFAGGWNGLVEWLDQKKVPRVVAEAAGLLRVSPETGKAYTFLHHRLTLAWKNRAGVLVAHVGRSLDGSEPKYLNPPEIPGVFTKGELLFGLHEALPHIQQSGLAYVAEGQLSCITPHLHGLPQCVATGGTSFGSAHARLLASAGARRLVFLRDGDSAGRKSARAAVPVALAEGLQVQVGRLPEGQDPDDYLRKLVLVPTQEEAA